MLYMSIVYRINKKAKIYQMKLNSKPITGTLIITHLQYEKIKKLF